LLCGLQSKELGIESSPSSFLRVRIVMNCTPSRGDSAAAVENPLEANGPPEAITVG